jgi:hypothetical protein
MKIEFYVSLLEGYFFGGRDYKLDDKATLTGRYQELECGEIFVEVIIKRWLFRKVVWIKEGSFKFKEAPVIYNCRR